jgi:DNA-binding FadR family transcriptional regulator
VSRGLLPIVPCTELAARGLQVTAQSLQSSTYGMMQSPLLGKGGGGNKAQHRALLQVVEEKDKEAARQY